MIFRCYKCRKDLEQPGALVFSPPLKTKSDANDLCSVEKYHICTNCFTLLLGWLLKTPPQ